MGLKFNNQSECLQPISKLGLTSAASFCSRTPFISPSKAARVFSSLWSFSSTSSILRFSICCCELSASKSWSATSFADCSLKAEHNHYPTKLYVHLYLPLYLGQKTGKANLRSSIQASTCPHFYYKNWVTQPFQRYSALNTKSGPLILRILTIFIGNPDVNSLSVVSDAFPVLT